MHQFLKLFLHDTLHVSDGLSIHHREIKTVHTATGLCQTDTKARVFAQEEGTLTERLSLVQLTLARTI